ncbi:hypothetical protein [Micromonospora sp. NPDC047730]|uniref:hypothetical protein n=1 Tax=Micromonospora sp. NPDC047730 TaxID=3364253 RepID=UPI0037219833
MTIAPSNLLAVRALLLEHLKPYGLSSAEVGIVGDSAHRGGYHCGRSRVDLADYSVDESKRDRDGLSDYASGLDIGTFSYRDAAGRTHNLRTFSVWLVAQCKAGTADTRDIREVIYSPDGKTVRRWDDLGVRSSGDDSHLWHTHISFYRDATKAGRSLTAVFRRYLEEIGLIDMPMTAADRVAFWTHDLRDGDGSDPAYKVLNRAATMAAQAAADASVAKAGVARLEAKVAAPAPVTVDASAVANALAGNAAFVEALAKAVADEQARRMAE